MKAHIGVDAGSGLVHEVTATPANEADFNQTEHLLHGEEKVVFGDAGYTGVDKRPEVIAKAPNATFLVASKPSEIKAMKEGRVKKAMQASEKAKASVRALVEHPFKSLNVALASRKLGIEESAKILPNWKSSSHWQTSFWPNGKSWPCAGHESEN